MKCWICEHREADSREHLIKASDMRLLHPTISPLRPVFMHTRSERNIPLRSAKSNKLKTSKPVICKRCNDTDTAAHDHAWSELIQYVHTNLANLTKRKKLSLKDVFPGNSSRKAILLHLYFVKLFGCRIVDEKIPIDLKRFSYAIRSGSPMDNLYLTLNYRSAADSFTGVSEIHGKQYSGLLEMATWYYSLEQLDVQVTWFNNRPIRNVPKAWNPNDRGKVLQFRSR